MTPSGSTYYLAKSFMRKPCPNEKENSFEYFSFPLIKTDVEFVFGLRKPNTNSANSLRVD